MRASLNYLLLLRPAGRVNWKVNIGKPITRKLLGCIWERSGAKIMEGQSPLEVALVLLTAWQQVISDVWLWMCWYAEHEVGWWRVFAVKNRMCD